MGYITYLDINGVRGDIPVNQVGNGAPTTSTVGKEGQFYMDKSTEDYTVYKCVNVRNGVYTWVPFAVGGEVFGEYVPLNGHTPNQMMATDANGDFTLMDIPSGGGSSGDSPIALIENTDSSNRVPLRSLASGTYVLKGYFTAYEGSSASYTFSTGMLVAVVVTGGITYVQIFYPKNNTIQYLEITDNSVTRQDAKLINMASIADMVTQVNEASDDVHYPSAKAVYEAISDALSNVSGGINEETDPTVPAWAKASSKPTYTASEVGALPSDTKIPEKTSDLTNDSGFITKIPDEYVTESELESKGYLTAHQSLDGYAKKTDIPTDYAKEEHTHEQYLTEVPSEYITETELNAKGYLTKHQDLSSYALKTEIPTVPAKISAFENDAGYIKTYTETDPTVPAWAKASSKPTYSKSEVGLGNVDNVKQYSASNPPPYPVKSVNGKVGAVSLGASDVGALPSDTTFTLGVHTDGLVYIFKDGVPVGTGVEVGVDGDVVGYVDSENNIVVKGNLADGAYTVKYEMEDGSTVDIGDLVLDSNVYYTITNNLTNCTTDNSATQVIAGQSYSATISAKSGYELKTVTATMGGNAVTVTDGVINIANVTGNIVITAVAEEKQAAEPVTVDIALTDGVRISANDGSDRTQAGYCATPHIDLRDIPKPCTIHLTKAKWAFATSSETGMIVTYAAASDGTKLIGNYTSAGIGGDYFTVVTNDGNVCDVTVTVTSDEVATIRFSGNWANTNYSDSDTKFASANTKATLTYTPES